MKRWDEHNMIWPVCTVCLEFRWREEFHVSLPQQSINVANQGSLSYPSFYQSPDLLLEKSMITKWFTGTVEEMVAADQITAGQILSCLSATPTTLRLSLQRTHWVNPHFSSLRNQVCVRVCLCISKLNSSHSLSPGFLSPVFTVTKMGCKVVNFVNWNWVINRKSYASDKPFHRLVFFKDLECFPPLPLAFHLFFSLLLFLLLCLNLYSTPTL